MNTSATIVAEAPTYAPDGSHGYFLTVTNGWRATGWIYTGDDGHTVYATIDRAPWRPVGTVTSPTELTAAWIAQHATTLLQAF